MDGPPRRPPCHQVEQGRREVLVPVGLPQSKLLKPSTWGALEAGLRLRDADVRTLGRGVVPSGEP